MVAPFRFWRAADLLSKEMTRRNLRMRVREASVPFYTPITMRLIQSLGYPKRNICSSTGRERFRVGIGLSCSSGARASGGKPPVNAREKLRGQAREVCSWHLWLGTAKTNFDQNSWLSGVCSTVSAQDQAAADHVVQRLLFFGETGHEVADGERDPVGDDFAEVAGGGAAEADALSSQIGHDQPQDPFAQGRLPFRAFHPSVIQPSDDQADGRKEEDDSDEHEGANIIDVLV